MASVPLLYRSISESITWQARALDWGPAPGMHCIEIQKDGKSGMLRDWLLVWETGQGFHIAKPQGVPKYLMHRLSALLVGSFSSVKELIAWIDQFVAAYNKNTAPFIWNATVDSILEKLQRLCLRISETAD